MIQWEMLDANIGRRSLLKQSFRMLMGTLLLGAPIHAISQATAPSNKVPKFHAQPPNGALQQVRNPAQYAANPTVERIYQLAAAIRPVLYQLPCYCSCDREEGHASLLDCYVSTHAVQCLICQREAVFAFRQTRRGKHPRQIREEILRGDWKSEIIDDITSLPTV
jgi:hypothetical protein